VSSMLSEPSDFNPQVFPDYKMSAWHHRSALVAVTHIGTSMENELFNKVLELVETVDHVTPVSIGGTSQSQSQSPTPSNFRVRYVTEYPVENNEWGEFQKHRQLLGLISVGAYSSPQELEELKRLYTANLSKYQSTVLDSRLIAVSLTTLAEKELRAEDESGGNSTILIYEGDGLESSGGTDLCSDLADFCTAIFWILESKRVEELQKEGKQDKLAFLSAPFEKKDFVGLDLDSRSNKKRIFGRYRKNLGDLSLLCDRMLEAYKHYEVACEILKSCNDWLWLASAIEGICAIATIAQFPDPKTGRFESVRTLHEAVDVLKPADVVDKYKEVVGHYAKYRQAGMIETEVSVKAVAVLTELENHLTAAEFLQNMVFINLNMNDREKVRRFAALSSLYAGIGFDRKAAFFLRVAAMRCVGPQNPHPDWPMCYSMLMDANYGYSKFQTNKKGGGWPALQVQLMLELVGTSRKMNQFDAAVIHLTRLLDVMFLHLQPSQLEDVCKQLAGIVTQLRSPEVEPHRHFAAQSGREYQLSYSGLKRVPEVTSFKIVPLAPYLRPKASKRASTSAGPFLFKSFGGAGNNAKGFGKVAFDWVENDVAEVQLELSNPLPVEIKVVNLVLLTEGDAQFESFPSTLSLGVSKEKITVSLMGVPRQAGLLKFIGYSCSVFGLPSSCPLDQEHSVNVIPSLPLLQGTILREKAKAADQEVESVYVMHGEKRALRLLLTNVSNLNVTVKDVSWSSSPQLPKGMLALGLLSDRLVEEKQTSEVEIRVTGIPPPVAAKSCATSKSNSLDNKRAGYLEGEFNSISLNEPCNSFPENVYDVEFRISYSAAAAAGQNEPGHHRELIKRVKVMLAPSAYVTQWDVMPSETLNKSYLVLDIENRTEHEVEITYDPAKSLSIEPGDECRIPLPVNCFEIAAAGSEREVTCCSFLQKHVNINWRKMPSEDGEEDREGRVMLDHLQITEEMMRHLELLPIEWEVAANGANVDGEAVSVGPGTPVNLQLMLSSGFQVGLEALFEVTVSVHGIKDYPLDEVCVQTQRQSRKMGCQPRGGSVAFRTIVLPLVPGKFDVECLCHINCQNRQLLSKFPLFTVIAKS